jgi:terminase small subunit / prophage DNA-packing protein
VRRFRRYRCVERASIRNYIIRLREQAAGRLGHEDGPDVVTEAANLKREQAALARARRQILEGSVISVDRIQPVWERHARVVRASVLAIASRVRAALPHLSAYDQSKIDEIARDSLTDLPQKAPAIEAKLAEALYEEKPRRRAEKAKR